MLLITFAILLINSHIPADKNNYFSSLDPVQQRLSINTKETIVYNKVPTKMIKLNKKSN